MAYIEFAINSAIAESTGQVPTKLTIGELPRSPLDVVVQAGSHTGAEDFVLRLASESQGSPAEGIGVPEEVL